MIGTLVVPSGWIAILLTTAVVLAPFSRLRRMAVIFAVLGVAIYGLFGFGPVAHALLGALEQRYPPLAAPNDAQGLESIVVLTAYASRHKEMPPVDQLSRSSIYRVAHAIWLLSASKGSAKIIISGDRDSAQVMRDVTLALGVAGERVVTDGGADDTSTSAANLQERLAGLRCALVTSAGHMPRAVGVFRKRGLTCVPAPVEFYSTYSLGLHDYLPSAHNLQLSDLAIHELMALIWYRLSGRL